MPESGEPILAVKDLATWFYTDQGIGKAVDGVSFALYPGKTLAVVGESGCGKSVTALSVLGLIPQPPGRIARGEVWFRGQDLVKLPVRALRALRGNDISMIFQEPMTAMNPVYKVGEQITAAIRLHKKVSKKAARQEAIGRLKEVGIPAPEKRIDEYPHQMSGGMLQRIMIAMALACDPDVLIADEPTTALDVTVQAQILQLLRNLQEQRSMAMLLITHDLGVVAEVADEVAVMYAGKKVEQAPVSSLFAQPCHPYTIGLFHSLPEHAESGKLQPVPGVVPAATAFPEGCRFHPRCPHAMAGLCDTKVPVLAPRPEEGEVACWLYDEESMTARGQATGIPQEAGAHG